MKKSKLLIKKIKLKIDPIYGKIHLDFSFNIISVMFNFVGFNSGVVGVSFS